MILIADGGSTKCDWAVVDSSHATLVKLFQTEGINPFAREEAEILTLLKVDVLPQTADYTIDKIYLYGAGITPEKGKIMEQLLLSVFEGAKVSATSDMEGAARGTVGSGDGIVVILGTGSNSAYYSGGQSVEKVAALGYILGDEGGGAVLGRTLLGDIFKGLPRSIYLNSSRRSMACRRRRFWRLFTVVRRQIATLPDLQNSSHHALTTTIFMPLSSAVLKTLCAAILNNTHAAESMQ